MKAVFKAPAALALAILVSGCGGAFMVDKKFYTHPIQAPAAEVSNWRTADVRVSVDKSLPVSQNPEAFFPLAQIDWWEDPEGDRHEQVQVIMDNAIRQGVGDLNGGRPVVFDVDVDLFHALTPRAREDGVWGWHDISYTVEVRDARTGKVVVHRQRLYADLRAYQQEEAVASEARGETQKGRITEHVAKSIRAWLASSG